MYFTIMSAKHYHKQQLGHTASNSNQLTWVDRGGAGEVYEIQEMLQVQIGETQTARLHIAV